MNPTRKSEALRAISWVCDHTTHRRGELHDETNEHRECCDWPDGRDPTIGHDHDLDGLHSGSPGCSGARAVSSLVVSGVADDDESGRDSPFPFMARSHHARNDCISGLIWWRGALGLRQNLAMASTQAARRVPVFVGAGADALSGSGPLDVPRYVKRVAFLLESMSGRLLLRGVGTLLGWLGGWFAEDVGAQLVARDSAIGGLLNGNASLGRSARIIASRPPITNNGLAYAELFSQCSDAAGVVYCFVEWVHRCGSSRFVLFQSTLIVLDGHHGS